MAVDPLHKPKLWLAFFLLFAAIVAAQAQDQRRAPEFRGKAWFNAEPYKNKPSIKAMRGKVVLVFFWTLDDPNCEGVVPLLSRWYLEHRRKGLEIVGVHTPEWEFTWSESDLYKRIEQLQIFFPVVVDDNSFIRDAYGRQSWPAFFLVDRDGYIRAEYEGIHDFPALKTLMEALLEESGRQPRLRRETR